MTHVFSRVSDDFYSAYPAIVHDLIEWGTPVDSRGGMTREIENYVVSVDHPRLLVPKRPGLSPLLGMMEGAQLIGSVAVPRLMDRCWPKMMTYTDHYGDYGARAAHGDQMRKIFNMLKDDPETRQAILTLWSPELDAGDTKHSDHPCTVSIGFRVRSNHLNMTVTMRSNDIWLGASSDFTQFTLLQATFAEALGYSLGSYTHFVHSMHIYERDVEKAEEFIAKPFERFIDYSVNPLARKGWSYDEIRAEAKNALLGTVPALTSTGTGLQRNIAKRLETVESDSAAGTRTSLHSVE
ncbi:thymidylate synthase [Gordonia phage GodonK]|uniref:thymidylate synthase n=1 Tax=Gordonia phage GodonK TaxID=2562192 RepID=A0A4D6E280_9CAUD|nr:thymidylate synthase [Gordonia phage GodonK]QBZ72780.1 thymidylate synthase [Gordonia phage GodonK]